MGIRDRENILENSNQGTIARTKHTSQHNYPPSVIGTKDGYLVIRTDPMVPGLGSSWKLLCVLKGFVVVVVVNIYLTVPGLI